MLGIEAEVDNPIAIHSVLAPENCNSNSTVSIPVVLMVAIFMLEVEVVSLQPEKVMHVLLSVSQSFAICVLDRLIQQIM